MSKGKQPFMKADGEFVHVTGVIPFRVGDSNLRNYIVTACNSYDQDQETIKALVTACKEAAMLYDHLALGTLEAAAKYGPDYEPPTDKDMLDTRAKLEAALALAKKD